MAVFPSFIPSIINGVGEGDIKYISTLLNSANKKTNNIITNSKNAAFATKVFDDKNSLEVSLMLNCFGVSGLIFSKPSFTFSAAFTILSFTLANLSFTLSVNAFIFSINIIIYKYIKNIIIFCI